MQQIVKDFNSFENVFPKKFYEKITKETLIPSNVNKKEFKKILADLYEDIKTGNYSPTILRGRLFVYKSNNVARVVPCLNFKDESLYFFLIKMIEEDIAINRVQGTFGGWRLGNLIKELENLEIEYVTNSYDPFLWNTNWKEFSNIVWATIKTGEYDVAYTLDIANFYDNINLNILEKKLLSTVDKNKAHIVYLLVYFLKYWNKALDNYNYKAVGIPQSEFGDQSRILANFYLQEYDFIISNICISESAKYVRYADDQIIFAKYDTDINKIMLNICNELNKIGLNINASKVKKFTMDELKIYYGYEIINNILEKKYNIAADMFFYLKEQKVPFREDTVLKKILNSGLDNYTVEKKQKILSMVKEDSFILENGIFYIKKVYSYLNDEEKKEFINRITMLLNTTYYNQFHYSVLKFAMQEKLNDLYDIAINRINEINMLQI